MKFYWKNILWNYTLRYWKLVRFYLGGHHKMSWSAYNYPFKRLQSEAEKINFLKEFDDFWNKNEVV